MAAEQTYLSQRLEALNGYRILDTPLEPSFDDITRLASFALDMPIALVSLVEEHRQWFKSEIGIGCRETPYGSSICAYAIRGSGIFEIEDLTLDPRTADNPLVTADPLIRFYAGAVLRTSDGIGLGTVCVLDRKPRKLGQKQREILLGLARQTMALLELRRALSRAQAFERDQSHYITVAGHDLRQPLQVIAASVELALRRVDVLQVQKHLRTALDAVKRVDLELTALAEAGSRDRDAASLVTWERVHIQEIFDLLTPAWQVEATRKNVRIDVVASSACIKSDRRLLGSILGNLVGNAIKYTKSGRILVGCRRRFGKRLEICVIDTGIGLSEKSLESVFAPFNQVDPASDGLGLGLSLVKQAADYLGYQIKVSSTEGIGSRFSVLAPIDS